MSPENVVIVKNQDSSLEVREKAIIVIFCGVRSGQKKAEGVKDLFMEVMVEPRCRIIRSWN